MAITSDSPGGDGRSTILRGIVYSDFDFPKALAFVVSCVESSWNPFQRMKVFYQFSRVKMSAENLTSTR